MDFNESLKLNGAYGAKYEEPSEVSAISVNTSKNKPHTSPNKPKTDVKAIRANLIIRTAFVRL